MKSSLYQSFMLEREEILKHKYYLSEKQSSDVGLDEALFSWVKNHQEKWRKENKKKSTQE